MINLLDTLKGIMTPGLITGLAGRLGESEEGIRKALLGAFPLVLGGILQNVGNGEGAQAVFTMAQKAYQLHGSSLGAAAGLLGLLSGSNTGSTQGGNMLTAIFGDRASKLATPLAGHAGISTASASSVLSMAGMAIPAMLGKYVSQNDLNAGSMAAMLAELNGQLAALLPDGMTGILTPDGERAVASGMSGSIANAGGSLGSFQADAADRPRRPLPAAPRVGGARWLFMLGVLAAVALLFIAIRSCNKTEAATTNTTGPTTDSAVGRANKMFLRSVRAWAHR